MSVTMIYGNYSFSPVPLISISKEYQKTTAGIAIGTVFDVSLNGNIVAGTSVSGTIGLPVLFSGIRDIRNAFDRDGKLFQIACDNQVLFECYPRITSPISFQESADHWVNTVPYTITLECDVEPVDKDIAGSGENVPVLMPPFISNFEDNWNFEFDQEYNPYVLSISGGSTDTGFIALRATHDISAVGKSHWHGTSLTGTLQKPAWQWAKDFVSTRVNVSPISVMSSGLFNIGIGSYTAYDYYRTQRISETEGAFGVTETYLVTNKNSGVVEDFTAEIRTNIEEPISSVTINGTIQGLEQRSYGVNSGDFSISTSKFTNASGYFQTIKDSVLIYPRAQALAAQEGLTLNITPFTKVIGKSPAKGQITYSYEYNNRPSNCITGARTESIQINDDNPSDVFSSIVVMGRTQGPILQSFNTVTEFKRTVSFDVTMDPPTGCSLAVLTGGNNPNSQVVNMLCMFENDLRSRYDKVYKERDTTLWEPKFGRYNRSVTWSAVDCTTVPAISLCSGA